MRNRALSILFGAALAVGIVTWSASPALAQAHHHSSGARYSGGGHYSHGGYYNHGSYHSHHGGWGWGGVGIYLGGYPWYRNYYGSYGYGSYGYPYTYGYDVYPATYAYSYPTVNYYTTVPTYDSYYYTPTTTPATSPQPAAATVSVMITDRGFNPNRMEINSGTTVRFTATGNGSHALAQPEHNWKSQSLSAGQTYSWTFSTPGTYDLQDATRPGVVMQIVVR